MAISYTDEQKFPILDTGGSNWGAVVNSALTDMDAGREVTLTANEALSQYEVVCFDLDGGMVKAKADVPTTMPAIGILPNDVSDAAEGKVRTFGWINNAGWSWTIGLPVYLSAITAGALTQTKPARPQVIGIAKTATKILIIPRLPELVPICNNDRVICNNDQVVYL